MLITLILLQNILQQQCIPVLNPLLYYLNVLNPVAYQMDLLNLLMYHLNSLVDHLHP